MESNELLNTAALAPNTRLWHYTNFKGLEGILRGTIWASSLGYMNDTEEFHHGTNVALEVLQHELALALRGDYGGIGSGIYDRVVSAPQQEILRNGIFVAALSTEEDDLSQWRAYGGTSGPMFSIGFDPGALERRAMKSRFELQEVKYKKQDFVPDVRLALQVSINELLEGIRSSRVTPQDVPMWAATFAIELLMLAPLYKHEKFEAEKEWRLVLRQPVDGKPLELKLNFRQSGSLVVPYFAIPLHQPIEDMADEGTNVESPITAIMIGPSPHPDENLFAIRQMAGNSGLRSARITNSQIPFRNW